MNGFIGTRAEREWLSAVRRIADALERLAEALEQPNETADGSEDDEHGE